MASSRSVDYNNVVANPTIEFLLKQVYALYRKERKDLEAKVKHLEDEIKLIKKWKPPHFCTKCSQLIELKNEPQEVISLDDESSVAQLKRPLSDSSNIQPSKKHAISKQDALEEDSCILVSDDDDDENLKALPEKIEEKEEGAAENNNEDIINVTPSFKRVSGITKITHLEKVHNWLEKQPFSETAADHVSLQTPPACTDAPTSKPPSETAGSRHPEQIDVEEVLVQDDDLNVEPPSPVNSARGTKQNKKNKKQSTPEVSPSMLKAYRRGKKSTIPSEKNPISSDTGGDALSLLDESENLLEPFNPYKEKKKDAGQVEVESLKGDDKDEARSDRDSPSSPLKEVKEEPNLRVAIVAPQPFSEQDQRDEEEPPPSPPIQNQRSRRAKSASIKELLDMTRLYNEKFNKKKKPSPKASPTSSEHSPEKAKKKGSGNHRGSSHSNEHPSEKDTSEDLQGKMEQPTPPAKGKSTRENLQSKMDQPTPPIKGKVGRRGKSSAPVVEGPVPPPALIPLPQPSEIEDKRNKIILKEAPAPPPLLPTLSSRADGHKISIKRPWSEDAGPKSPCAKRSHGQKERDCSQDSFDLVPEEPEPDYKYKRGAVKKRDQRNQLPGQTCNDCDKHYADLPDDKRKQIIKCTSRHRDKYVAPSTPENFWSTKFPSTAECYDKGLLQEPEVADLKPRRLRRDAPLLPPKVGRVVYCSAIRGTTNTCSTYNTRGSTGNLPRLGIGTRNSTSRGVQPHYQQQQYSQGKNSDGQNDKTRPFVDGQGRTLCYNCKLPGHRFFECSKPRRQR